MEKLIELFCHAIRITDPLSIKIAVGIVGGGLPLIIIVAALVKVGEFATRQRQATLQQTKASDTPILALDKAAHRKEGAGRRSRSGAKKQSSDARA
jgi:hypothetical protein